MVSTRSAQPAGHPVRITCLDTTGLHVIGFAGVRIRRPYPEPMGNNSKPKTQRFCSKIGHQHRQVGYAHIDTLLR
jgi:hypothetical protein